MVLYWRSKKAALEFARHWPAGTFTESLGTAPCVACVCVHAVREACRESRVGRRATACAIARGLSILSA